MAWHHQFRELDRVLAEAGGAAPLGMDDLFAIGPPDVVFPALERFIQDIQETCLLQLERSITQVFTWDDELPPSTPAGYPKAGKTVDGQFLPGFMCYGIPVGSPQYVRHELSVKVQEVAKEVEKIVSVMEGEGQAIWTILRSSTAMKLDYHLSLCYPSDMLLAAREMDNLLWLMLEKAAGLNIPRIDGVRGV